MADTHCHNHNESVIQTFHCSSCKSDTKMSKETASPQLEDAINKFVERRCDLAHRQRYLKDKVSTLERSIPALMAFNMWMSGQKCKDAPLYKIREIMNKFSPYPDPTEKLLEDLKKTVDDLNRETGELHEKIIAADVNLEEIGMELESLMLSNKEMGDQLKVLEKEVDRKSTFSLHSIHSEDLVCLTKIRQLGEEERNIKCCIKQLEEKEMFYRKQMECLLTSKDFQNTLGGAQMAKRLKELEANDRKWRCTYQTQKYNMHQMKKKIIEKEQELARLGNPGENQHQVSSIEEPKERKTGGDDEPIMINKNNWTSWNKNKNVPFSETNPNCLPRSCCVPLSLKTKSLEKKSCHCSSKSRPKCSKQNLGSTKTKFCVDNSLCQSPPRDKSFASCPPEKTHLEWKSASSRNCPSNHQLDCKKLLPITKKSSCRCSCKGRCARGKSEFPCHCGTGLESNYHPKAKIKNVRKPEEETSSDDEFCECDCGCDNEDDPGTCLFK